MYQFCALHETSLQQIAECFNLAFSDYEQPINFTSESLQYYLTASAVDLSLSFGAFCNDTLIAFILNSSGIYLLKNSLISSKNFEKVLERIELMEANIHGENSISIMNKIFLIYSFFS